jgi:hypothetical protein
MYQRSNRSLAATLACALALLLLLTQIGCGNDDYIKPIKQFQDASAVVIASARQTYQQMNQVEENAEQDRQVFEKEPVDEKRIKARDIITKDEIDVRIRALDQLSRYTSALADLATLKAPAGVTKQFQDVSSAFTALAKDTENLSGTKSTILDNKKFSGIMSAATIAIGTVVRAIEEHKARHKIEEQIRDQDGAINALIQLLGDELDAAYQRRKQADSEEHVFLTNNLKTESDPALRLFLSERLKNWRNRQEALADANPQPSINAMQKAHQALVTYVTSDKGPKNLSDLYAAAQDFFSRVQPLAQATADLLKSK